MSQPPEPKPHIAILGAGPTGIEAALAAAERGFPFTLYEAAPEVGGDIARWRHVRLFTPWSMNASARMRRQLAAVDRAPPDGDSCPTGGELRAGLLEPLAALPSIRGRLRLGTRVLGLGRQGLLKHQEIATAARAARPFRLLLADARGGERIATADRVLDCTGTPVANSLGDGGIPAPGEAALAAKIVHHIPDRAEALSWAGQRTLLVGAGHSAQTAARALAAMVAEHPGSRFLWAMRNPRPTFAAAGDDPLPERAALGAAAAAIAASPAAGVRILAGVVVESLAPSGAALAVTLRAGDGTVATEVVDRVLALTGAVGDHRLYRQLQVHECYATEGPMKLAAALLGAGAGGDCLQQTSLGADTLRNPEPGFFLLGIKSYGRRNDYLMRVGWQQVDEVFASIDG